MIEFRSRVPVSVLVVGLVAVALVAMVVDRRAFVGGDRELSWIPGAVLDLAAPVQKMIALPVGVVRDAWSHYVSLVDVEQENIELRGALARLEEENLQLREALVASGRLERIAEMREQYEIPMLPTELVGVDSSPWFRSVLVDRGRERGVVAGMPLISEQGLVGLVTATSSSAAKAMLILDRQSAIDAVVQRSRSRGVLRGRGTDELELEYVARGGDVEVGDLVMTSGLGGVYPKGLRIGEVVEVTEPGPRLIGTATVRPAVDFGRLEQVFVMLRRGPTLELLYSAESLGDESEPPSS